MSKSLTDLRAFLHVLRQEGELVEIPSREFAFFRSESRMLVGAYASGGHGPLVQRGDWGARSVGSANQRPPRSQARK